MVMKICVVSFVWYKYDGVDKVIELVWVGEYVDVWMCYEIKYVLYDWCECF